MSEEEFAQGLRPAGRFVQGFPLLHHPLALEPSPDGTVYEQHGQLIVPTNAPAGTYRLAIALGRPYAEEHEGWVHVGELVVRERPRPANGA